MATARALIPPFTSMFLVCAARWSGIPGDLTTSLASTVLVIAWSCPEDISCSWRQLNWQSRIMQEVK